ncbi:hypothetical protein N8H07_04245 [Klebsiella michiganensis]|uniref:hypothetical protein n=1 Tax=Klebsiella michiganensis TaxID=1134687 RepID=UPI002271E334|nr:hypothetical protein [Klebsiella michiganensis]ELT9746185.1 hypothetical protein [Klebsiella michiganensis]MCY0831584.1 hypothetical protein [Klebsiella michiganensis]MDD7824119.1 hypothetical protein [Klebsiella michiganensis]MDD7853271.1 hypothetical protein [Klebsiella michiganensis]HBM2990076.1 hypothetical protein [Klebsiella michiganensis]
MDDIKDSLIQTIRERFGNPMWGYIALSWLGFNWKNIAILFVSKSTIEERIKVVTSQDYLYLHYLIIPVVVGCVLAASSPYIKWAFSKAHEYGESMLNEVDKRRINAAYQKDIDTANKKVERDFAARIAEADKQKELVEIEETKKQLPYKTENLLKEHGVLTEQCSSLEHNISIYNQQKDELENEINTLKLKVKNIAETFNRYNSPSNHESIQRFLEEISKIFNDVVSTPTQDPSEKEAASVLGSINKAYRTALLPQTNSSKNEYKSALENIQQTISKNPNLSDLISSTNDAFNDPSYKKIHELVQNINSIQDQYPQLMSLASQTREMLNSATSDDLQKISQYAELLTPQYTDVYELLEHNNSSLENK